VKSIKISNLYISYHISHAVRHKFRPKIRAETNKRNGTQTCKTAKRLNLMCICRNRFSFWRTLFPDLLLAWP